MSKTRLQQLQLQSLLEAHHVPFLYPTIKEIFEQDNRPKLSARDAKDIRSLYKVGFSQPDLATHYRVNKSTISRIVRGVYYS